MVGRTRASATTMEGGSAYDNVAEKYGPARTRRRKFGKEELRDRPQSRVIWKVGGPLEPQRGLLERELRHPATACTLGAIWVQFLVVILIT